MNQVAWIVAVVVVVVVVALVAWWLTNRRRRSEALRDRFGPEYERTVEQHGERGEAERVLEQRAERVDKLDIRPLTSTESAQYATDWRAVQAHFVDDPEIAIA